jgi:uncharacterized protein YcbK (DUF882 family)
MDEPALSRRGFCKFAVGTAAALSFGRTLASSGPDRRLRLHNYHNDQRIEIQYCAGGVYDNEALDEINHFLRCHYTNKVSLMDVDVLDVLCDIQKTVGRDRFAEVYSGYRSPAYNELLRRRGRKVAKNSLHTTGQAIDFTFPGMSSRKLARIARSSGAGGVGTYRGFVHVDTGPVRSW